jgi:hypothetical protein
MISSVLFRRAAAPVGVGTKFVYNGEIVTIVEMFATASGNGVRVEDRGGKRQYWLSLHELLVSGRAAMLTTDEGPRSDDDIEIASVVLANLEAHQLAKVDGKAAHVREVLTGYRSGTPEIAQPNEPRPQYQPNVPLKQRYASKADEIGKDPRTVERWVAGYKDHGEAGLTTAPQRNPDGRVDPRWIEAVTEIMVEKAHQSRPNRTNIFRQAKARLEICHGTGVVPIPTRSTAYRRIKRINKQIPTFN